MLVCPIIFSYRQFLELSLKYQLDTCGPPVKIKPIWDTHDLDKLWAAFLDMVREYGTKDPDDADPIIEQIVVEFSKIDPGSYSFSYPYDKKGKLLPLAQKDLDLKNLADVMKAVAGYFNGCDGFFKAAKNEREKAKAN